MCLFGIFANAVSVAVVKNKRKQKQLNNFMYKHLMSNAIFNLFYCLINIFTLMSMCIFPRSSYCSSVYKSVFTQYFKIYIVFFLGNTLRLCSNFSYIALSVSRFYLSTSKSSRLIRKFENIKLIKFYAILIAICFLLSLFKVSFLCLSTKIDYLIQNIVYPI